MPFLGRYILRKAQSAKIALTEGNAVDDSAVQFAHHDNAFVTDHGKGWQKQACDIDDFDTNFAICDIPA